MHALETTVYLKNCLGFHKRFMKTLRKWTAQFSKILFSNASGIKKHHTKYAQIQTITVFLKLPLSN